MASPFEWLEPGLFLYRMIHLLNHTKNNFTINNGRYMNHFEKLILRHQFFETFSVLILGLVCLKFILCSMNW